MKINQRLFKNITVIVIFTSLFMFPLTQTFASQPKVSGTISDSGGAVSGASVTAQCDSFTSSPVTSDGSGNYSISVPTSQCSNGHTVTITAHNSGNTESGLNTGSYTGSNITINVTISSNNNVPEFNIYTVGLAAISSLGAFLILRKKNIM